MTYLLSSRSSRDGWMDDTFSSSDQKDHTRPSLLGYICSLGLSSMTSRSSFRFDPGVLFCIMTMHACSSHIVQINNQIKKAHPRFDTVV